ncbi:MAG: hypothetical protein HOP15_12375 [Planctomycetes bacterium]|nr:hypothetical protein [Planctomycetota bacterium]
MKPVLVLDVDGLTPRQIGARTPELAPLLFWWWNLGAAVDWSLTPRPFHPTHGR